MKCAFCASVAATLVAPGPMASDPTEEVPLCFLHEKIWASARLFGGRAIEGALASIAHQAQAEPPASLRAAVVQLTVRNLRRMVEEDAAFLRSCGIAPEPIERVG